MLSGEADVHAVQTGDEGGQADDDGYGSQDFHDDV